MSRAAKLVQTVRPILALGRLHRAPHAHSGSGEDLPHQPEPTVRPTEYHWVVREPDSIKADLAADTIMSCGPKAQRWRGTSASRPDDRVPPSVYAASASSNRPRPAPHRTTVPTQYPHSTHTQCQTASVRNLCAWCATRKTERTVSRKYRDCHSRADECGWLVDQTVVQTVLLVSQMQQCTLVQCIQSDLVTLLEISNGPTKY